MTTKSLLLTSKSEPSNRNPHKTPEKTFTTEGSTTTKSLMTTKPLILTTQPELSSSLSHHTQQILTRLWSMKPMTTMLTTKPEKTPTTEASTTTTQSLMTTKSLLLTSQPESSGSPHTQQMSTRLWPMKPMTTMLTTQPEKISTTKASRTTQNLMTTKLLTGTNQPWTSKTKHTTGEWLSTLFLMTDLTSRSKMYMNESDDEATSTLNMNIILISVVGLCQILFTTVIILFMRGYYRKQRPTNESTTLVTSLNQATQTVDSTPMPYQKDFEPEPNTVFKQGDDSLSGTMIPNPEDHHKMHTYEHTIKMHSMAASSKEALPKVDSTHMPHQTDSKLELNAVRMGVASLVKTKRATPKRRMTLPNLVEFQNMPTYEHTIEMH